MFYKYTHIRTRDIIDETSERDIHRWNISGTRVIFFFFILLHFFCFSLFLAQPFFCPCSLRYLCVTFSSSDTLSLEKTGWISCTCGSLHMLFFKTRSSCSHRDYCSRKLLFFAPQMCSPFLFSFFISLMLRLTGRESLRNVIIANERILKCYDWEIKGKTLARFRQRMSVGSVSRIFFSRWITICNDFTLLWCSPSKSIDRAWPGTKTDAENPMKRLDHPEPPDNSDKHLLSFKMKTTKKQTQKRYKEGNRRIDRILISMKVPSSNMCFALGEFERLEPVFERKKKMLRRLRTCLETALVALLKKNHLSLRRIHCPSYLGECTPCSALSLSPSLSLCRSCCFATFYSFPKNRQIYFHSSRLFFNVPSMLGLQICIIDCNCKAPIIWPRNFCELQ